MASESAGPPAGTTSMGWPGSSLTCSVVRLTISGSWAECTWSIDRWCLRFAGSPPGLPELGGVVTVRNGVNQPGRPPAVSVA
jgi:hypothetical protein